MKEKLQLIYNQFLKLEPPHGKGYHQYNLARCHLRDILHKYGGRDEIEQMYDELEELRNGKKKMLQLRQRQTKR